MKIPKGVLGPFTVAEWLCHLMNEAVKARKS